MKMKNCLCLLMSLLLLSSCGASTAETSADTTANVQETTVQEETTLTDLLPDDMDFGGYTFTIAMPENLLLYDNAKYILPEGENGELLNDTALRRNFAVEERYNIKLAVHYGPQTDIIKDVQQVVMAGESSFDLVQFASAWNKIMPLIQDHALLNLLELPNANLDADYFYGHLNEQLTINGKLYTGFSSYNNSGSMPLYMVFNKNMMTDMGMEMPYEAILNGDWTYDVFLGYIKDAAVDLDGDGKQGNTDQWGFANLNSLTNYMVWGFDIHILQRLDNGTYVPDLRNERFVDAVQKVTDLKLANPDCFAPSDFNVMNIGDLHMFMLGNIMFSSTGTGSMKLRDIEEFDFGIAPFPKYDENQQSYTNYMALDNFGVIVTAQDLEIVGAVAEGLAVTSKEMMEPAYLDVYVENKLLRDEESVEVAKLMMESACIDFTRYFDFANGAITPVSMMNNIKDPGAVVSHLTSVESKAVSMAEEFFAIFFEE